MPNAAVSRLILSKFSESLVRDTARAALEEIGGRVSLGVAFCSADYREHLEDFLETLQLHAHIPLLVGCSGTGFIGTGAEAERASGFSLLLLHLPNTRLHTFTFDECHRARLGRHGRLAQNRRRRGNGRVAHVCEPGGCPDRAMARRVEPRIPRRPVHRGLSSGGRDGGDTFVFQNRTLVESGALAVGLKGGVTLHTLVSQGCRPIGAPLVVTSAEHNLIQTIGSRPAYEVLDEAYQALPERDRERARGNLFAGLAMREDRDEFHRGDFLVRNILGADEASGIVAIGAFPRVGQTVQFQLRDAHAADDDLRHLSGLIAADGVKPFASLLFSCGGRGRHLFNSPNHDASVLAEIFTPHPSAGIFCNGEIGPVGGRNFIHAYTASAVLFS